MIRHHLFVDACGNAPTHVEWVALLLFCVLCFAFALRERLLTAPVSSEHHVAQTRQNSSRGHWHMPVRALAKISHNHQNSHVVTAQKLEVDGDFQPGNKQCT